MFHGFSEEIRSAKRQRRKAERRWRTTKLDADWTTCKSIKNRTTFLMYKARIELNTDIISECSDDQRKLFTVTRKVLNQASVSPFPPQSDKSTLVNDIGLFFVNKIFDIRIGLDSDKDCDV